MNAELLQEKEVEIDILITATFYLMTRYAKSRDQELIAAISMHLEMLENHPNSESSVLEKSCKRLKASWLSMLDDETMKNIQSSTSNHSLLLNIH
ncbi:MAG: hypothetical protein AAF304_05275 [Pseudomonadota bacterium]